MEKELEQKPLSLFKASLNELKSTKTVVFCGLMGAMAAVLSFLTALKLGPYITIGISWIPSRIVDYMFGPAVGMIFGGVMDIVKHIVRPLGPFDFRFILVPMLSGLIYGYFLYKKPISLWRIFLAKTIVTVFLNLGVNTYLIASSMGKGYLAILPPRFIKNMIALPIEAGMMFFVLSMISIVMKQVKQ